MDVKQNRLLTKAEWSDMILDGLPLYARTHPKASIWRRFLMLFKRKRINPESLESCEIDIK